MTLEGHLVAQLFQPFDASPSRIFRLQPVQNVRPGVVVRLLPLDPIGGQHQHRVGHGPHGALLAAPRREPPGWRTQRGPRGPRGGMGRLD
jgi:hypothetical protein